MGLLGGSFDPPHLGHLHVARAARDELDLTEVRLVPACRPPHKHGRELAADVHRVGMLELLAGRDPWLRIDRRELQRGGTSYTFDTLREIHQELDGADLFFLIGSDSLIDLADWHRAAETVELATFVTVPRDLPGLEFARAQVRARLPDAADRILAHVLDVEPLPISSSQIRSRVRLGLPIDELVPRAVAAYVARHGLYLDAGASAI